MTKALYTGCEPELVVLIVVDGQKYDTMTVQIWRATDGGAKISTTPRDMRSVGVTSFMDSRLHSDPGHFCCCLGPKAAMFPAARPDTCLDLRCSYWTCC